MRGFEHREKEEREEEKKQEKKKRVKKKSKIQIPRARTRGEFVKPTVEEVAAFCKEKGYNIDPTLFVSYYETKGWIVGRTRMKNWHSAVALWERNAVERAAARAAINKEREKRFNNRSGGWTPPPICDEYKEAQLAELRKAGF